MSHDLSHLSLSQLTRVLNAISGKPPVKKAGSTQPEAAIRVGKLLNADNLAIVQDLETQFAAELGQKPAKAEDTPKKAKGGTKKPKAKRTKKAEAEPEKEPEVGNLKALVDQAETIGTVEGLKRLISILAKNQGVKLPPNFLTGHIHKNHRGPIPLHDDNLKFVFTGEEENVREGSKISQRIANTKKLEDEDGNISVVASVKGKWSMHRSDLIWAERKGYIEFVE